MYPELPGDTDLVRMIDEVLAKRSKSYVNDAHVLARVIKERLLPSAALVHENLTATQARCTELLNEVRRLKRFRARVSRARRAKTSGMRF